VTLDDIDERLTRIEAALAAVAGLPGDTLPAAGETDPARSPAGGEGAGRDVDGP
jgi:hypothetical protein